jgi:hypothetical protein
MTTLPIGTYILISASSTIFAREHEFKHLFGFASRKKVSLRLIVKCWLQC